MKTPKLIILTAIMLIVSSMSAIALSYGNHSMFTMHSDWRPVTYVVQMENTALFAGHPGRYQVVMTDEWGRLIAPPQDVIPGKMRYTFREFGHVWGTRIARVLSKPAAPASVSIPPSVKTGYFYSGVTYLFILIPGPAAVPTGKDSD
jgi:hypothetical protein